MATNKFLPFATGSSPNVITDAAYAALAAQQTGFQSGTALSQQLNKVWRQSSVMAAVLGQIIANNGVDATDSDSVTTLVTNLLNSLYASPTLTGDPKAPTPATSDNDTSIATTAFVKAVVASYLTTAAAASTYAPIASPVFTGDPQAPTAAQFDNDVSLATTAFVKRALGNYSNFYSYGSSQTLTASHVGGIVQGNNASGLTFTLPLANAVAPGSRIEILNVSTGTLTVSRQSSDVIYSPRLDSLTSVSLSQGDSVVVESNGTNWYVSGGTAQLPYSATPVTAKAWVNFNGSTAAIRASFNVSSVTRNGTGDYTVNFTTAMPDTNYAMAGFANSFSDGTGDLAGLVTGYQTLYPPTKTAFRFASVNSYAGDVFDASRIAVVFFR